ncbi:MAG: M20/M25/M40 family metallo-hydrolase [Deltaproteobacteria bacterium]|nr:M20/M25/M40 family metallo-hydrolase [Deltaproteobacteria bacterium]
MGRGACEQKGPLAAMIGAAGILARSRTELRAPFYLVVSLAGETGRHDAASYVLEHNQIRVRYGIVGLGTCNRVCLGNKGRIDIDVVVRGKSCHSSTPWAGIDAIKGARRVMDKLDALALGPAHPHLGATTLTPTRIESGPPISHTIQDVCRIVLDRRLLPGQEPQEALEAIRASLGGLEPWTVEVTPGALMYPSEVAPGAAIAEALQAARAAISKGSTEVFYLPASLDAGFLLA